MHPDFRDYCVYCGIWRKGSKRLHVSEPPFKCPDHELKQGRGELQGRPRKYWTKEDAMLAKRIADATSDRKKKTKK